MLTVGQLTTIEKELILGIEPTNTTPEANEAREAIRLELAQMEQDGIMPELPCDFD